ncbi:hypothetical protein ACHQM5_003687 [Ranunculus cassubicifolius]
MATKMKGIYKGFKYISSIFVVKEREMEIGFPTDVKHVAHIGWDGQSDNAPTWMKEYKTTSNFSAASVNDLESSRDPNGVAWTSRDLQQSLGATLNDRAKASKKQKRKKIKSATSSPKSTPSTARGIRTAKSKSAFAKSVSQLEICQNVYKD